MRLTAAAFALLAFLPLASCAKEDPAYEAAVKDWADKSCDCYRLPMKASQDCFKSVHEPDVPSSIFDKMQTNPNYRIRERYFSRTQACLKAWQAREGVRP
jgi:hypothetical protein